MNPELAIELAKEADRAFELALRDAGYQSRWAWWRLTDHRPLAAYMTKVAADLVMQEAIEQSHKQ